MSTWTYLQCDHCRQSLWLEKFLGYYPTNPDDYSFMAKLWDIQDFVALHSGHAPVFRIEPNQKDYSTDFESRWHNQGAK